MLYNAWVGQESLSAVGKKILENVIDHKKAFFNASYANYDDCLSNRFRLIPGERYTNDLNQDFKKMISAGMFYEAPQSFEVIMSRISELEKILNSKVAEKTYDDLLSVPTGEPGP